MEEETQPPTAVFQMLDVEEIEGPRKRCNAKIIVLLILVLIALGGGGLFYYYKLNGNKNTLWNEIIKVGKNLDEKESDLWEKLIESGKNLTATDKLKFLENRMEIQKSLMNNDIDSLLNKIENLEADMFIIKNNVSDIAMESKAFFEMTLLARSEDLKNKKTEEVKYSATDKLKFLENEMEIQKTLMNNDIGSLLKKIENLEADMFIIKNNVSDIAMESKAFFEMTLLARSEDLKMREQKK